MKIPVRHIFFSDTAARSLAEALQECGQDDRVLHLSDNLSLGPINPYDPVRRGEWIRGELMDFDEAEWPFGNSQTFWNEALANSDRRIAWVSKCSAHEYAGFLEFVWRLGDAACDVIEFDRQEVSYRDRTGRLRRSFVITLGEMAPELFAETRWWECAVPLNPETRERCRADWARLRDENAPLRILDENGMISAPLTYFDDLLMSYTAGQWRKSARVLGEALMSFIDGPFDQVSEFVLHARLRALVRAGRLESKGDLCQPRFSEVRWQDKRWHSCPGFPLLRE
jgi:hypothetical protein